MANGRRLLGATKPAESAPGTIRADFALAVGRNLIHGSDSVENAKKVRRMGHSRVEGGVTLARVQRREVGVGSQRAPCSEAAAPVQNV